MAGETADSLFKVFESFASFGARGAAPLLDSAKFAKLCRDCSLLDKKFTTTQADLIFTRVKAKGERKINFDEFLYAIDQIGIAKFPGDPDASFKVIDQILNSQGPMVDSAAAASLDTSGIFGKLTDSKLYTGSHKERFDAETGTGKGLAGRDRIALGAGTVGPVAKSSAPDLSEMVRTNLKSGSTHLAVPKVGSAAAAAAPGRPGTAGAPPAGRPAYPSSGAAAAGSSPGSGAGGADRLRPYEHRDEPVSAAAAAAATMAAAMGGGGRYYGEAAYSAAPVAAGYGSVQQYAAAAAAAPAGPEGGYGHYDGASAAELDAAGGAAAEYEQQAFDLHDIFLSYCSFGGTSSVADEMDSAKFSKLCREAGVIGKGLPPALVDVTFSKVKEKGKRTLRYEQFTMALALLARDKFPHVEPHIAEQMMLDLVLATGGPGFASPSMPATTGVYEKLTDHTRFTGSHKERFDAETGAGRGLAGRETVLAGVSPTKYHGGYISDLSQITRPHLH